MFSPCVCIVRLSCLNLLLNATKLKPKRLAFVLVFCNFDDVRMQKDRVPSDGCVQTLVL